MTEQFGLAGIWEDLKSNLLVDVRTYGGSSSGSDLPLVTKFTITNGAPKSDTRPEILFEEVILRVGVPPELHVEKHTNLASGESFTYEHRSRYSDLGRIVFSVDGTVSPSHLLRVRRAEDIIPHRVASLSISSYVEVLKDIDIHRWIKGTIEEMTVPGLDTTEAEIEAQQNRFKDTKKEINDTKKQLKQVLGFIIRTTDTDRRKISEHEKLLDKYLTQIIHACDELSKMLDTHNAKTIDATRNQLVTNLEREATAVDEASRSLLG